MCIRDSSDTATLDRVEIIRDLRQGKIDVLVGINLLREGLDIPEVSLVAILDADKEGDVYKRQVWRTFQLLVSAATLIRLGSLGAIPFTLR